MLDLGRFIWEDNELLGYRALVSTQVPSNLEKGASGTTLSAMIFGNWSQLIIANWGGVDIIIDEITRASQAEFQMFVHFLVGYWRSSPTSLCSLQGCGDLLTRVYSFSIAVVRME